jgi:hypothetical protein
MQIAWIGRAISCKITCPQLGACFLNALAVVARENESVSRIIA